GSDDHRGDALAEPLVGNADDGDIAHAGELLDDALDLFWPHLLACSVDRGRAPTEQPHRTIGCECCEVTGHRPTLTVDDRERRGRPFRVLVVAEWDVAAARQPS